MLFSTVGFTDNLLEFKRSKTTVSKAQADQSTSLHRLGLRRMRLGVGSQCGFTCDVEGDEEDKADRGKEEEEEGEEEAGGAEAVLMRAEPLMAPAPCLLLLLLWGYCLAVIDGEGQ